MTRYFLLFFFGLFSLVAQAQTAPPVSTAPAALPELSAGRRDTLGAIGSMYARRRHGGTVWIVIGAGFTASIVRGLAAGGAGGNAAGALVGIAVFGGIPAAIGIAKKASFSEAKENEADRAYRSGQPLPRNISRRLKRKDFE